jgi:hypothetical protein
VSAADRAALMCTHYALCGAAGQMDVESMGSDLIELEARFAGTKQWGHKTMGSDSIELEARFAGTVRRGR